MQEDILVSVLLPCYNHERYVESCIRSIIAQTYNNIEFILCDDCSNDSSYEIALSMEKIIKERFSKVKILRNEQNNGVTKNANKMIKMSEGQYVKFLATDDMLKPDAIEKLVKSAEENKAAIVYGNVLLINDDIGYNANMSDALFTRRYNEIMPSGVGLTSLLCEGCFLCAPGVIFSKNVFNIYGGFDESLSFEDWEFYLRVSKSEKIVYLDELIAYYRVLDASMSHFKYKEELERYEKYHREKMKIFYRYCECCSMKQIEIFYNKEYFIAIKVGSDKIIKEINSEINKRDLRLYIRNKIYYIMYKLKLFGLLKKLKNLMVK